MSCKLKYTPTEFIAIMAIGFVQGHLPPSIDKEGKPVYVLQKVSSEVIRSGCAATLVIQATANATFLKNIASLTTHEACNIGGVSGRGVNMWDIVEFQNDPLRSCYGGHGRVPFSPGCSYCERTKATVIEFFQKLQNCHDQAAVWYHTALTAGGIAPKSAIQSFRNIVLMELKKVAAIYGISWPEVEVAILTMDEPLRERVPAINKPAPVKATP